MDFDLLDVRLDGALGRVESAGTKKRQPRLTRPADVDVDGVVERRALADETTLLLHEIDEIPVEAGVEPRSEAGRDVGRQHCRAEQDRVEATSTDQVRGHVHTRLWEWLLERRIVRDVHLARAVATGLLGQSLDARACDQRRDLAAELNRL